MRIPLLNLEVKRPDKGRPLAFGKFFGNPERDMVGYRISFQTFYDLYRTQGDVYACIRELKEGVGRNGYHYYDAKGQEIEELEIDYLLNALKPWRQLKAETIRDKYISGNAFWALVPNITGSGIAGVQRVDPRTMSIVATETGEIVRYIQRHDGKARVFDPEEIVHFKLDTDPSHEVYGLSPMESVIREVWTDVYASRANQAFFENYAQPSALYILEDGLNETEKTEVIDSIKSQFQGADKMYKAAVFQGIKEVKTLQMSQKDMEYLAGREYMTNKICAAYGVPKFMLGYTENVNYNNSANLMSAFAENTITPAETDFAEQITRDFFPKIKKQGISMVFDPQTLDEQKELEARALEELKMGVLTPKQYKTKTRQKLTSEEEKDPFLRQAYSLCWTVSPFA
jgi:HK97 family phage portal protein